MPRLLPQLRRALLASRFAGADAFKLPEGLKPKKRQRTLNRPLPSLPPLTGRSKSVLLDEVQLVKRDRENEFMYHKKLPPRVRLNKKEKEKILLNGKEDEDVPREMTEDERSWYSSPWLRMLSSPMRQCIFTRNYLPSDFLIRVAALRKEEPADLRSEVYLLPDGILHPRYAHRATGLGRYLLCRKSFVSLLQIRGIGHRVLFKSPVTIHALLENQIGWQLRERVIQEVEFLAEQIRTSPISKESYGGRVARKMTNDEWSAFGSGLMGSWSNAVAGVLVMCPTQLTADQTRFETLAQMDGVENEQMSYLQLVGTARSSDRVELGPYDARVPVYNMDVMFLEQEQRERFETALEGLLQADEQAQKRREKHGVAGDKYLKVLKKEEGPSNAVMVISDEASLKTADSVPLAIALWRVRMWEGEGFANSGIVGRWLIN